MCSYPNTHWIYHGVSCVFESVKHSSTLSVIKTKIFVIKKRSTAHRGIPTSLYGSLCVLNFVRNHHTFPLRFIVFSSLCGIRLQGQSGYSSCVPLSLNTTWQECTSPPKIVKLWMLFNVNVVMRRDMGCNK